MLLFLSFKVFFGPVSFPSAEKCLHKEKEFAVSAAENVSVRACVFAYVMSYRKLRKSLLMVNVSRQAMRGTTFVVSKNEIFISNKFLHKRFRLKQSFKNVSYFKVVQI
jgi:hypothetical protein